MVRSHRWAEKLARLSQKQDERDETLAQLYAHKHNIHSFKPLTFQERTEVFNSFVIEGLSFPLVSLVPKPSAEFSC